MLTRRLLTIGAVATLTLAAGLTGSAAARDPGAVCPPTSTNCDVWDGKHPNPGDPGGSDDPGGGGGNDGAARKCNRSGQPVPCYDDVLGWFNPSDSCYYKLAEPQPEGVPEGKDTYLVSCAGAGVGSQVAVDLAAAPAGFGAPPDPEDLAALAFARLELLPPRLGIAPDPNRAAGLVGLPIWLWVDSPDEQTWGPQTEEEEDRGVHVWISAKVEKVVWHMGNTARVTCYDAGEAYESSPNKNGPPPCGYENGYPKPSSGAGYDIYAVATWRVDWGVTNGADGPPMYTTRTSGTRTIQIDELQVVTR